MFAYSILNFLGKTPAKEKSYKQPNSQEHLLNCTYKANVFNSWNKIIAVGENYTRSLDRLLTLSLRYVTVTCLTHGTASEGGEGEELHAGGGGSVMPNIWERGRSACFVYANWLIGAFSFVGGFMRCQKSGYEHQIKSFYVV